MAAGWKKLKVGEGHSVEAVVSYLADPQARGDYYTEGGAFLRWLATPWARTRFALGDYVPRTTLTALLSGRHPVDGTLIRRYGPDGTLVGGIDVTLSPAPKSVSILWALGDDSLRAELEELVLLSVNAAIGRMLDEVALVRQRYGPGPRDVRHVQAEDWVGVQALHTTARLSGGRDVPDPQLHVHNVLIGALDAAGQLRAIDTHPLSLYRSELDAEASADLAERLRRRGWPIERQLVRGRSGAVKRMHWEVAGVPEKLVRAMSRRRAEVEELRDQYRQEIGRDPAGPRWERYLEEHRGPKARRAEYEMYAAWMDEAAQHEFGPEQVAEQRAAAEAAVALGIEARDAEGEAAAQLRREILADLCRTHALVPERELNKLTMQRSIGLMDPYEAMRVVAQMFADGDLLASTDGRVTTLEVLAAEQRATAAAQQLLEAAPAPPSPKSELDREFRHVEEEGRPFDERQRHAVALATGGGRFVSISGPAGTGKGHASRAMTAIWRRQGRRVIAAAVAGRTSQQAQADSETDEAYTLEGLATRLEAGVLRLARDDVLLVDEAGMIDHHQYARLLEAVAEAGATLVQVGDDRQLSPVEAGGLWTVVHEMAAARGRTSELTVVRRARDSREAQAWTDLREGRVEEALSWYRDQGRLRLYDTRQELLAGIVADWWSASGRGVMVVDSSNEERDELNRLAQERRRGADELGPEALRLASGREIRVGDRVLFNAIYRPAAEPGATRSQRRVENGTAATVVSVEVRTRTAALRLHEPKPRHGEQADRELVVPADVPLELAYARHVYKAQGMTAEVADVATGPRTRHNELYTMLSRSRDGTRLHALRVELEALGADPGRLDPATAALPPGTWLVSEVMAEIEAELARRDAEETVTIREIARRAERSSTKEAAGSRAWQAPAEYGAARAAAADRRARLRDQGDHEGLGDLRRGRVPITGREERVPASPAGRRPSTRPVRRAPAPEPMPAREAIESMARAHAADGETARFVAYYEVMGRLHVAADPAEAAARRWLADRDAVVIVADAADEERVRAAATRLLDQAAGQPSPDGPADIPVLHGDAAYRDRRTRREEWLRGSGRHAEHRLEPGVLGRAYVVVTDIGRIEDVVRAVSIAAQAHLVAPEPNPWLAAHTRVEVERIRASLAGAARVERLRQAGLVAELQSEREAPHSASHSDRSRENEPV